MKASDGLSDSIPSGSKAKCERCGATERLHTGVCVSCLLGEGLQAGDEVSRTVFESAIAEVNVPDKQWRLGDYEIEVKTGGKTRTVKARLGKDGKTVECMLD